MKIVKQYLKFWKEPLGKFICILPRIKTSNIIFDDNSKLSDKISDCTGITDSNSAANTDNYFSDISVLHYINYCADNTNMKIDGDYIYLRIDKYWIRWKSIKSFNA